MTIDKEEQFLDVCNAFLDYLDRVPNGLVNKEKIEDLSKGGLTDSERSAIATIISRLTRARIRSGIARKP